MSVLVWTLVLFAAAQAAVVAVKDRWRSLGPLHESKKLPQLRELARSDPKPPLALMVGSSRVSWAFQAGRLNGEVRFDGEPLQFFNFGVPATGVIHALLRVQDLLREGIHPKVLLVEFLPPLLGEPHGTWASEECLGAMPWMSYSDMNRMRPYLSRHGHVKVREWFEARLVPWYVHRNQLTDEFLHAVAGKVLSQFPGVDEWGACVVPPPAPPDVHAKEIREALEFYRPTLQTFRVGVGPTKAMRELLSLCAREKIHVVLVVMPESTEFRKLYSDDATATAKALLDDYAREFQADVIDADRWIADDEFSDGHHVLPAGACKFTDRLGRELQRLFATRPGLPPRDPAAKTGDDTEEAESGS